MSQRCYRVLAIDGGGIRGLIPAHVLKEVEAKTGRRVADLFDLVAGTSTGGILALGLTKPGHDGRPQFSASDMCDLYLNEGSTIFPHSIFHRFRAGDGVDDARYPAAPIEQVLDQHFGDAMLSQALVEVVVPSYDLTAPGPYFFKREYARTDAEQWDVRMAFVARATSAAPTYFDPAVLPSPDGRGDHALVDGGTFANNPTMAGYVDALRLKPEGAPVLIVSIGTGLPPQSPGGGLIPIAADHVGHYGLLKWARPLLDVVLDGVPKAVEYQMDAIRAAFPDASSYYRLQSDLPTASHALDDASAENCQRLIADADKLVADSHETLERIYGELSATV